MGDDARVFGYVGCGHVGERTLISMVVAAGIDVAYSVVGDHEPLADLAEDFPSTVRIVSPLEAAESGDWLVLLMAYEEHRLLPTELAAGKPVIDMTNYYPGRHPNIDELDVGAMTSSELLQRRFKDARVVKAINNIDYKHFRDLARSQSTEDRTALPIAGDDKAAKKSVTWLLERLGFDVVDAGPLSEGWRFQPGTPACHSPYGAGDASDVRQQSAASAPTAELRRLLDAAER